MTVAANIQGQEIKARKSGFLRDVYSIAGRALRSIPREPEAIYPALIIPVFFFAINVGALQDVAERIPGLDYKAFQLPVAIIFAVTGISRAVTLVTDIQTGYFDRLPYFAEVEGDPNVALDAVSSLNEVGLLTA